MNRAELSVLISYSKGDLKEALVRLMCPKNACLA